MRAWAWIWAVGLLACAERDEPGAYGGAGASGQASGGSAGAPTQGAGGSDAGGASGVGGSMPRPRLVQSGSRLEAIVYRGADGSQHPTGEWFDTKLGISCTFRPATDGQVRCLPKAVPFVPSSLFETNACAGPVAMLNTDCGASDFAYFSMSQGGACEPAPKLFHRGTAYVRYETPPDIVYQNTSEGCKPRPIQPGEAAFGLGPEAPPTDFVAATIERLLP